MHLTREAEQAMFDVTDGFVSADDTADLIALGMRADGLRRKLHPEGVVTYTNTVRIVCPVAAGAFDLRGVFSQIEAAEKWGATGVMLDPTLLPSIEACEGLVSAVHANTHSLWLAAFEPHQLAALGGGALPSLLARLRDAGLDSILEGDNLEVHRAAHHAGMTTGAVLPVLAQETASQRARRLAAIRELQQETGRFHSLAVTAPALPTAHLSEELTAVEYLTALACARLAVPNIPHVASSWRAQGLKLLQMTLRFGANDAGSTHLEQGIARPGPDTPTEEALRHVIRDAGFTPVERSADYTANMLS